MEKWISVKEQLIPHDLDNLLLNCENQIFVGHIFFDNDKIARCFMGGFDFYIELKYITHWMPLPSPPKDK